MRHLFFLFALASCERAEVKAWRSSVGDLAPPDAAKVTCAPGGFSDSACQVILKDRHVVTFWCSDRCVVVGTLVTAEEKK